MNLTDTRIHQIELLLTLDYLLNHTDEDHPATQISICEHAKKFGLRFDKNAKSGNQIRRQRVGECLKFLKEINDRFPAELPFLMESTDSGKFYIEQRGGLSESQVAKILAAITNDKYTKDEDVSFLSERILGAFSSGEENRRAIDSEYKNLVRSGKKYGKEDSRKINLVEKAYREGKMIKIRLSVHDVKRGAVVDYFFWYRVYLIKEIQNKLYAFMLPIGQIDVNKECGRVRFFANFVFDSIEDIDVADGTERNVLCADFEDRRDFEQLFRQKCPALARKYGTIDGMLEKTILPKNGTSCIVTFYFNLGLKKIIKRSFENYFSEEFRYREVDAVPEVVDETPSAKGGTFKEGFRDDATVRYGLANISVDLKSFKSWLLSDPHGDGCVDISDMVTVTKPISINQDLAVYHYLKLKKRVGYLPDGLKEKMDKALSEAQTHKE